MSTESFNNTVLCVDDEEGILDFYRQVLDPRLDESMDILIERRNRRRIRDENLHPPLVPLRSSRARTFRVMTARSGEEAVDIVRRERERGRHIAAGFFDMKMPGGMDGLETIRLIKNLDPRMLCAIVTAYTDRTISHIASVFERQEDWIYFNKPFTEWELIQACNHLLSGWNLRLEREHALERLEESNRLLNLANEKLFTSYMSTVRSIIRALEARDPYTAGHSHRVAAFGTLIGRRMGLPEAEISLFADGFLLHDIGKVGIADNILRKPGLLTPSELNVMRTHPVVGAEILAPVAGLTSAVTLVRHHHERWDGRGYPDGLGGLEIPLGARILAVADTFDAITSTRSYREARSMLTARDILVKVAGSQHDRDVSRAFISLIEDSPELVLSRIAPEALDPRLAASIRASCPACDPAA